MGADGTVGEPGVVTDTSADSTPSPIALIALILILYVVELVKSGIAIGDVYQMDLNLPMHPYYSINIDNL